MSAVLTPRSLTKDVAFEAIQRGRYVEPRDSSEMALPDDADHYAAFVARDTLPADASRALALQLQVSYDGGATWEPGGACTVPGGVVISPRTGLPETHSGGLWGIRPGKGRLVRVTIAPAREITAEVKITCWDFKALRAAGVSAVILGD